MRRLAGVFTVWPGVPLWRRKPRAPRSTNRILRQQAKADGTEVNEQTFGLNARREDAWEVFPLCLFLTKGSCSRADTLTCKRAVFEKRNLATSGKRSFIQGSQDICQARRQMRKVRLPSVLRGMQGSGIRGHRPRYMSEEPYCAHQPPAMSVSSVSSQCNGPAEQALRQRENLGALSLRGVMVAQASRLSI